MTDQPDTTATAGPFSRLKGKTFLVVDEPPGESGRADFAALLKAFGGIPAKKITPRLDYLIVPNRRSNQLTDAEREANDLIEDGADIRILDQKELRVLLSPTAEEALSLLRGGDEGLALWRSLRDDMQYPPLELPGVDLRGCNLTHIVLYGVNLEGADLREADLTGSSLSELVRVNLDGANLAGAYVPQIADCTARNANFERVRFGNGIIDRTDFTGAKMTAASGNHTRSVRTVFRDADMTRTSFQDGTFAEGDFSGANLDDAHFENSDLSGCVFRGADLTKTSFTRAKFVNADLTDANLSGANLAGADLTGATVAGANFTGARLYAAKLDNLGPGVPVGLVLPPPIQSERIGPAMRQVEVHWRKARDLELHLIVSPDGGDTKFASFLIRRWHNDTVTGSAERVGPLYICQAETPSEVMLELASLWPEAVPVLESVSASAGSKRETPKGFSELALAAWHEAFDRPLPTPAERKAQQAAHRERFLAMLRGGPDGVKRWNDLPREARRRAGHFRRSVLVGCNLRGVRFGGHRQGLCLDRSDFSGADLTDGGFSDCSLVKSRFRKTVLDGAFARGTDLREADFEGASLRVVDFSRARCQGANFQNADLFRADFEGADVRGADFSTANLDQARFLEAKHDDTTKFPVGFDPDRKPPRPSPSEFVVGGRARITRGAFKNFEGVILSVLPDDDTVNVEVVVLGRATVLELRFDDAEVD